MNILTRILVLIPLLTLGASPLLAQYECAPPTAAGMDVLRSFHSMHVRSETVYMKSELLTKELRLQPQFADWKLELATDTSAADIVIQVNRPFLTFDWTYRVREAKSGQELLCGYVVASEGHRAAERLASEIVGRVGTLRGDTSNLAETARTFRKLYVESQTVYLKSDVLHGYLRNVPSFQAWNVTLVADRAAADLAVDIQRPFMTFDWVYKITHPKSGKKLAEGSIEAWDGPAAAPVLANAIAAELSKLRGLPATGQPAGSTSVATASAAPVAGRQWRVNVQAGLAMDRGTPMTLGIVGDRLVGTTTSGAALSVPVADVVAVTHNDRIKDPAQGWWQFWGNVATWGTSEPEPLTTLAILPVALVGGGILEMGRTDEHYVNIAWRERGMVRELVVKASPGDVQPLLAELQSGTRQQWKDVENEVSALQAELAREKANAVAVEFDRAVRLGWKDVPAGAYQVVLLDRGNGRGDLYLFSGNQVKPENAVAQAVVQVEKRPASVNRAGVLQGREWDRVTGRNTGARLSAALQSRAAVSGRSYRSLYSLGREHDQSQGGRWQQVNLLN